MALMDQVPQSMVSAWKSRVQSAVRVRHPSDADRIAELCVMAECSGDRYVNVWHEAAAFYGTPCHCRRCNPMI